MPLALRRHLRTNLRTLLPPAGALLLPARACLLLAGALAMLLNGCGYHRAGAAVHLPQRVHLIDVPTFRNHTQTYHVELSMTQAVLKELGSRTPYRVTSTDEPGEADVVIRGEITSFVVFPLTYDSTTNQSSSFLITVGVRVSAVDKNNRVLYQNNSYIFRQQYQTTQDLVSFIQEDPAAVARLSRDFAQNLVSDILESF